MYRALELGASVCLFGHTHIPIWRPSEDLLTMNPGAYMDDFRIIIEDDYIYYYFMEKNYKKFEFKW
jgi:predicted phosphodiesterase